MEKGKLEEGERKDDLSSKWRLKSFLEGCWIVFKSKFKLAHRIVTVASNEIGCWTIRKINLFSEVLDCFVVFMDSFIAHASVVKVLKVFRVWF